ncbi:hypothetical protein D3C78_1640320 [compost metagenome]
MIGLAVVLHQEGAGDGPLVLAAQHGLGRVVRVQHEADDKLVGLGGELQLALGIAQIDVVHRQQARGLHRLGQVEVLIRIRPPLQRLQVVVHPADLVFGERDGIAGVQSGQYDYCGHHQQQYQPEPKEYLG